VDEKVKQRKGLQINRKGVYLRIQREMGRKLEAYQAFRKKDRKYSEAIEETRHITFGE
jgi:hypothetical protein